MGEGKHVYQLSQTALQLVALPSVRGSPSVANWKGQNVWKGRTSVGYNASERAIFPRETDLSCVEIIVLLGNLLRLQLATLNINIKVYYYYWESLGEKHIHALTLRFRQRKYDASCHVETLLHLCCCSCGNLWASIEKHCHGNKARI